MKSQRASVNNSQQAAQHVAKNTIFTNNKLTNQTII